MHESDSIDNGVVLRTLGIVLMSLGMFLLVMVCVHSNLSAFALRSETPLQESLTEEGNENT